MSSTSASASSKFSSITPSSYRPSYSSTSGTYRASRAPPASSLSTPSYTRTYSSLGKTTIETEKEKPKSYTRTYSNLGREKTNEDEKEKPKTYTRTYSNLGRDKTCEDEKEKPKAYTRSYSSIGRKSDEKEKEKKESSPPKRVSSSRYGSTKDLSSETKTRLTSTFGTAKKEEKGPPITFNTRYKVTSTRGRSRDPSPAAGAENGGEKQTALQRITAARSRDPSPASSYSRLSTTASSRDPSPVSKSYSDSTTKPVTRSYSSTLDVDKEKLNEPKKTYGSAPISVRDKLQRTYSATLATNREKSRDPSPSLSRRPSITSITSNYARSRDASPDNSYLLSSYRISNGREKSRDPSPTISLNKTKLRESSPLSISNISSYRRPSREPSPSESLSKYSTPSSYTSPSTTKTYSKLSAPSLTQPSKSLDVSISYMSASDSNSRPSRPSRISYINRHSPQKESSIQTSIPLKSESPIPPREIIKVESESDETTSSSSSEESDESSEDEIVKPEPKIMIQVTTITRGTSPNPSTSLRVRRIEFAKTIEKVRQRALQSPSMADKSTQSDRMDDSTRNSRYGITSRTPYSPYSPSPTSYSSRYTPRYSRDTTEIVEADKSDSDRMSQKSDKFNFSLPKSKETSPVKNDTSRSSSIANSPSPSRISVAKDRVRISASKTPEKPPQSPTKSESPKIASVRGSNKDFRKSALNMGPTDRVRRSKSSSSDNSSPTVEKTVEQFQNMLNGSEENKKLIQSKRSESVESDSSTESIEVQSQIEQKYVEPTKEEIINHKVEEAKSYLLKTLGNVAALNSLKSPVTVESESEYPESLSTNFNSQTNKLDFSGLQKSVSGEKPWWMDSSSDDTKHLTENEPTITQDNNILPPEEPTKLLNGFSELTINSTQDQNDTQNSKWSWMNGPELSLSDRFQKLERVQSGEKAWWCNSPENKITSDNQAVAQNVENSQMWEQETQADISEIQQDDEIREIDRNYQSQSVSATPLGDRASPEGLEANFVDRKSPYDNLQGESYHKEPLQDFNARPRLFISRHTNIDDLLGEFIFKLMETIVHDINLKYPTGGHSVFRQQNLDFELITPDAVKFHDSTSPPKIVLNRR